MKISVTMPDDLHAAAKEYAARTQRSLPNLCTYALRLFMSKYAPQHKVKSGVPSPRNGAVAGDEGSRA